MNKDLSTIVIATYVFTLLALLIMAIEMIINGNKFGWFYVAMVAIIVAITESGVKELNKRRIH